MVEYNLVKYCISCKKRFVVKKSESRTYYCKSCQSKIDKEKKQNK